MRGQLRGDIENRLAQAVHTLNGTEQYVYNPSNQRVWKKDASQNETAYIYGPDGARLVTMSASWGNGLHFSNTALELRLGGRLITSVASGDSVESLVEDRLGSGWASQYFPYGETRGGGPGFQFATYRADSATQFDYAQQRYYSSKVARFLTPDPYVASGGAAEPQSWNRYAYVEGDPIDINDPTGLCPPGMVEATPEQIEAIIDAAMSYVRMPHAGNGHFEYDAKGSLIGIDCSGLVATALAGIVSKDFSEPTFQFSTWSMSRDFSEDSSGFQRGDLIWFPGHVGIVTDVSADGSIKFIGAQSSGVAVVDTADPTLTYWSSRLPQARAYKPCVPVSAQPDDPNTQRPGIGRGGGTTNPGGGITLPWWIRFLGGFMGWVDSIGRREEVTVRIMYEL